MDFEVAFLRRSSTRSSPSFPVKRLIPENQPFTDPGLLPDPLAREKAVVATCRDEPATSKPSSGKKRADPSGSRSPRRHPSQKKLKAVVVSWARQQQHQQPKYMSSPETTPDGSSGSPLKETIDKGKEGGEPYAPLGAKKVVAHEPGPPKSHPLFGLGGRWKDSVGEPVVQWDGAAHRISVSTLQPSWADHEPSSCHAYALGFDLYGHEDIAAYKRMTLRQLTRARSFVRSLTQQDCEPSTKDQTKEPETPISLHLDRGLINENPHAYAESVVEHVSVQATNDLVPANPTNLEHDSDIEQHNEKRATFADQKRENDDYSYDISLDEDFVTALEYGMSPASGMV
ncbi:hypothetical protein KSP39_PZI014358 [Platanthera zijinensis]|uniref:Uncharacterized protein n=1 Tax=Platanthera zijinensis TaxID=2320716 RepID=A0AAP0G2M9_9ASPA